MKTVHFSVRPQWRAQWFNILLIPTWLVAAVWILIRYADGSLLRYAGYGCVVAALYVALRVLYTHFAWRFTIDDDSIESRRGVIGRTVQSIRIDDLRNINVRQSLIERMLGVGSVEFSTAGGSGIEVVFFGVEDPLQLKEGVQQMQEERDRVRGSARSDD